MGLLVWMRKTVPYSLAAGGVGVVISFLLGGEYAFLRVVLVSEACAARSERDVGIFAFSVHLSWVAMGRTLYGLALYSGWRKSRSYLFVGDGREC
jgi:hypothetical protein